MSRKKEKRMQIPSRFTIATHMLIIIALKGEGKQGDQ